MSLNQSLKTFFEDRNYCFVLIFGSYSDNSYGTSSDIDIGVFFESEVDYMTLGYQSAMLESKLGKKIDIIVLNDLYKKDPLFAFQILENHTPVVVKNQKCFVSFKTSCQLYYLDHKHLIDINKKALQKRIKNNKIGERNFA